jgi:hypothetical protein
VGGSRIGNLRGEGGREETGGKASSRSYHLVVPALVTVRVSAV